MHASGSPREGEVTLAYDPVWGAVERWAIGPYANLDHMTPPHQSDSDSDPEPDPRPPGPAPGRSNAPGPQPRGSVPPGETPPDESSMSGAGPDEAHNPPKGWSKGPLAVIIGLAVLVAAFFLVYALVLLL